MNIRPETICLERVALKDLDLFQGWLNKPH